MEVSRILCFLKSIALNNRIDTGMSCCVPVEFTDQ
uniref:Uncharacterized protein n=1 Tax=Onchocerca volvulus TaxID=6282 RepID=A0A8R1Y072_ONCVO